MCLQEKAGLLLPAQIPLSFSKELSLKEIKFKKKKKKSGGGVRKSWIQN